MRVLYLPKCDQLSSFNMVKYKWVNGGEKMITRRKSIQSEVIMMTMEDLVPEGSLYRKIEEKIDFTFIYEAVEGLYCEDNGRPSIDPVVLFKLVFIQTMDGIKSMRKTCEKIKTDAEYRWFLGIPFGEETPHFSTLSKNYERRFRDSDIFEKIFINIVNQADQYGLVGKEELFTDSTHKKANANKLKFHDEIVKKAKNRKLELEAEINEERKRLGKKEFAYSDEESEKHIKVSTTDPESGYYHRDEKEKGFMYLDHRTVDGKANIIVDSHITKGNVHDSKPYLERLKYIKATFDIKPSSCALDSGYDNMAIKRYFDEEGIFGVIGYRRYGQSETEIRKWQFKYLKELDAYVCPKTGIVLEYRNLSSLGYKEYYNSKACSECPYLSQCCKKSKHRKIRRHLHEEINERARFRRLSPEGKELAKKRRETIERSFADSKCNHGYRYAMYRGLIKNQHYSWLACAAQNMKNIAIKTSKSFSNGSNASFDFGGKFHRFLQSMFFQKQNPYFLFRNRGLSTVCGDYYHFFISIP